MGEQKLRRVGPYRVTRSMGSTVSAVLSTAFKLQGPSFSISSACSTGAHCIGVGMEQIQLNKADIAFCGAGEAEDWGFSVMFDSMGALFGSYGAELVDAKGNITVNSDAVKQVLEYMKKLVPFLPPDVFAWDDASNNKWLVSGKGALIMNPPSAWAVAKRDAVKVAEQLWTFPTPRGPKGRYQPYLPFFWGIWKFSKNKSAAKSLMRHISTRSAVEKMVAASQGYDIPAFSKLNDFKTWAEEGPPKGTLYNYPPKPGQILSISAFPAPPKIAAQIYTQAITTKMVAKCTQGGESIDKAIAWAASELQGFMRS